MPLVGLLPGKLGVATERLGEVIARPGDVEGPSPELPISVAPKGMPTPPVIDDAPGIPNSDVFGLANCASATPLVTTTMASVKDASLASRPVVMHCLFMEYSWPRPQRKDRSADRREI